MGEPIICESLEELALYIAGSVSARTAEIIGIDGMNGSGKTCVARKLSFPHVNVDDFLVRNEGSFLRNVKYGELETHIQVLRARNTPVIVEGVCLLDVLDRLHLRADCLIYIKRIGASGTWHDQDICEIATEQELNEWLEEDKEIARTMLRRKGEDADIPGSLLPGGLTREIAAYHHRQRPIHKAHYVYLRREE